MNDGEIVTRPTLETDLVHLLRLGKSDFLIKTVTATGDGPL